MTSHSHNIKIYLYKSSIDGNVKDLNFVFCERTKWWTFFQAKVAGWASSLILLSQRIIGKNHTCTTWPGGMTVSEIVSSESVVVSWLPSRGKFRFCKNFVGLSGRKRTCRSNAVPFRPYLSQVSFKCIAKRCRLLTLDSRSLHKAIAESGLAEVPWMFSEIFLCLWREIPRWKIWKQKTESLTLWLYDGMGTVVCVFRV